MNLFTDNLNFAVLKLTDYKLIKLNEISKPGPEFPGWIIDRQIADRKRQIDVKA